MKPEKVVLCASSKYEQKFYLNEEFKGLPEEIKKELKNIDDEAYSLQLKIYQKYVAKMLKKPVFLYLYSILEGKMTKIED